MLLSNLWLAANKLAFLVLLQEKGGEATGTEDFSLLGMIRKMQWPAIVVAIVLMIMSIYSIAMSVEGCFPYNAQKNKSRHFPLKVAQAFRENRIDEPIAIPHRHKKSHLAM